MLTCTEASKFLKRTLIPFSVGIAVGVLGHRLYKSLRKEQVPSTALATLTIINLNDTTFSVSGAEFKHHVTVDQLNNLRSSVGWLPRAEDDWQKAFNESTNIVCV